MMSSSLFASSFSTVSTITLCDGEFDNYDFDEDAQTFADEPIMFRSSFLFTTIRGDDVVTDTIEDFLNSCSSLKIEPINDDTRIFTMQEQQRQSLLYPQQQDHHVERKRDLTPRLPKRRDSIVSLSSLETSETTMISVFPDRNNNGTSVQQEQEQKIAMNYYVSKSSIRILCRNKPFRSMAQYSRKCKKTIMDSE